MLMDIIKARHSIRKYTEKQINREDLEKILEAGNFAPNAGGGQRSMMVAVNNSELTTRIGIMNLVKFDRSNLAGSYVSKEQPSNIDDPTIKNGIFMVRLRSLPYLVRVTLCFGWQTPFVWQRTWYCRQRNLELPPASFQEGKKPLPVRKAGNF